MPSVPCQGYCGGHYRTEQMTRVGREGERFCRSCFARLQRQRFFQT